MKTGSPLRRVATVWRRSIQARVVISTLLLSAVVVSLVGWVLLQQITDGLVHSRTDSAVDETTRATAEAQRRLSAANGNDFDASTQLTQLVATLVVARLRAGLRDRADRPDRRVELGRRGGHRHQQHPGRAP